MTKNLILGLVLMIFGASGVAISIMNINQDAIWLLPLITSVVSTVDGVTLLDNLDKEKDIFGKL